jgi:NitT/TauT family transport system permease protein
MSSVGVSGLARRAAVRPRRTERRSAGRSALVVNGLRLALVAAFFGAWQLASDRGWVDPASFSSPSAVWDAWLDYVRSGQAAESARATLLAVLLAFVIGTTTGTLVGFVLGISDLFGRVLDVFIVPLNSMPRIALAPLFVIWFGITTTAKVALAVTIVFFVLVINAKAAVKSLDRDILLMARVTGYSGWSMIFKVVLPASVPAVFAGLRLCITYALLGVVASEMIAARSGIGLDVVQFTNTFNVAGLFAVLIELALLATLVDTAFGFVERWLLRWQS